MSDSVSPLNSKFQHDCKNSERIIRFKPLPQNYQIDPPIGSCLSKKKSPSDRIIEEEKTALEETSSESIEEDGANENVPEFFSKDVFLSPLYASTGNAQNQSASRELSRVEFSVRVF